MRKQTKPKQTRENVINNQKEFFKTHITDDKGYLLNLSENLFVPFRNSSDEDYLSFKHAKGKELEEKLRAPHSSAALCVNFFKYWKEKDPIAFYKVLWETMYKIKLGPNERYSPVHFEFEVEHLFGSDESRQTGRPGFIDLEIRTEDGMEVVQVESKFTEEFHKTNRYQDSKLSDGQKHNRNAYRTLFSEYFECDPDDLMNGSELSNYYQLAQRLLFVVENANKEYASVPGHSVLFLYYDHEDFDKSLLEFPNIIREDYRDDFKILSYQELFNALKNSFLNTPQHHSWFNYMGKRYFNF